MVDCHYSRSLFLCCIIYYLVYALLKIMSDGHVKSPAHCSSCLMRALKTFYTVDIYAEVAYFVPKGVNTITIQTSGSGCLVDVNESSYWMFISSV